MSAGGLDAVWLFTLGTKQRHCLGRFTNDIMKSALRNEIHAHSHKTAVTIQTAYINAAGNHSSIAAILILPIYLVSLRLSGEIFLSFLYSSSSALSRATGGGACFAVVGTGPFARVIDVVIAIGLVTAMGAVRAIGAVAAIGVVSAIGTVIAAGAVHASGAVRASGVAPVVDWGYAVTQSSKMSRACSIFMAAACLHSIVCNKN
jgi:hypothetical protein